MAASKQVKKEQKTTVGVVVSSGKMQKTVAVQVTRQFAHPLYKKVVRVRKTYKVHDEQEQARSGDIVEIYEGRHMSKTKYMYLSRVVTPAA
ncbi:MAG: 30S ribosomal protein S17 [candidate division TM6 bacterium GW2011_GWF2_43_17]|nr:MAG: 30S ribosomal protein S17 [candidate division TM6 bacterium GW2011_GWF2_43_17]HAU30135.1 30S ribosomal protein S17 [Candidatus Dependentiae bacterium]